MKRIITVSREFGSGGRTIGRAVAEMLGYSFYDKELIEKIAEQSGLSHKYIEDRGECSHGKNIFSYAFVGRDARGVSLEDYLWRKQRDVILDLTEKGNCVIVGRCSDYILRDRKDCLHVFIHADKDSRIRRIVNLYGETDQKPEKRLMEKDKARQANYRYYTCGDYCVATKEKLVEILYFRHFAKHFMFTSEGEKIRNKHLKNYFDVSVMVDIGCGNTNEK